MVWREWCRPCGTDLTGHRPFGSDRMIYRVIMSKLMIAGLLLVAMAHQPSTSRRESSGAKISRIFQRLDREASWRLVATVPLGFNAHHPQGMVRVGGQFFLTTVEVTQATRRFPAPVGRFDRDEGAGVGHLVEFSPAGRQLSDLQIGEGSIYHPGGIDYDGRYIWIPVAEYRPNSRSIVYRVDPAQSGDRKAVEACRVDDHLGGIVHWIEDRLLVAVSWGARRIHQLSGCQTRGRSGQDGVRVNPSFYIDYQDCHYLGRGEMLCGGLRQYADAVSGKASLSLGGLELVDLVSGRPIHQLPVEIWTSSGRPLTQNPFWVEPLPESDPGLRGYFIPEDGKAGLLIYEIRPSR